ncbi:DUF4326 domain-containing protein [Saccharopolyspora sp. K220]|uniref:DUF4326 domain-containing protein n=1 Tax=Saccharopolyspora soli TaxID=2926618 RepID=UPI001F5A1F62|nr:DUF4326 domain-containing protein [Saccharopolyspora soli]MCI2421138.1 DUF4326 domain-containing protein [Saccharopolyspora soli]
MAVWSRDELDRLYKIRDCGETVVVNVRRGHENLIGGAKFHGRFTYIGRGSKWGNPFRMGVDGDRSTVIHKYRQYLLHQPELLAALGELRGHALGCYCAPEACHGDVLIEIITERFASAA